MNNYKKLQDLYTIDEIQENCVNIDFCYAYICAMASSELDLQQWMPLLFIAGECKFSNEQLATDFAQCVLAIFQQAHNDFNENTPLAMMSDESSFSNEEAAVNFADGYLQALIMIDNMQIHTFAEGSDEANLQQTCFLLLDKLATMETKDEQKLAMFAQLPSEVEIVAILPVLLSRYGQICVSGPHND